MKLSKIKENAVDMAFADLQGQSHRGHCPLSDQHTDGQCPPGTKRNTVVSRRQGHTTRTAPPPTKWLLR